jgi:PAS domain-containing protein
MSSVQHSLELILARNLVENISVPALVLDANGVLAFFNQSAADIIGSRFEETGPLSEEEWRFELSRGRPTTEHTPWSTDSIPAALREGRPAHERFHLRGRDGERVEVEASIIPLVGPRGVSGGVLAFWPVESESEQ